MKRWLAAAVGGLAIVAIPSATGVDSFAVNLVSQTSSTITLGWSPQPGYGYLFSAGGVLVSRTNDPNRSQVRFSKVPSGIYDIDVITKGANGHYPSAVPPPPKAQCEDGIDNDADGKIDYPNDPGCTGPTDNDETNQTNPPPTGYPDGSNTGVPAGTVLTTYAGPYDISANPTVIDSKRINGCLDISSPNVTIRNSEIHCVAGGPNDASAGWGVRTRLGYTGTVTIVDTTITCDNTGATGAGSFNMTLLRVNIFLCDNGLSFARNLDLRDSYLHDWGFGTENHADGIQEDAGLWGTTAANWQVIHNTIFAMPQDGSIGNASWISDSTNNTNMLWENNLFGGGTFTLYCPQTSSNVVVRNNRWTTRWYPKSGMYGPVVACRAEDGGGNLYYESGLPVDMTPE